jgi:flagellar export protein FliJ
MKRYEFNLESVMRVRRIEVGVAKAELQKANVAAKEAELEADKSQAHYEEVSTSEGSSWMAQTERAHLAAETAILARESLASARAAAAAALQQYMAASRAVSVLSHLDETRREEHAAAVQHEEMGRVDELVTSRHVRRQAQLSRKERR